MKSIMISIKPKWVAKILNGKKTIEIRKTMPKCDLPITVYIYCTKEDSLCCIKRIDRDRYICGKDFDLRDFPHLSSGYDGKGKVVAKFTLNKVRTSDMTNCLKGSCLSYDEVNEYTKGKKFYSWVIDNLVIFDRPKELSEFKTPRKLIGYGMSCNYYSIKPLTKAPQSWGYCESEELL